MVCKPISEARARQIIARVYASSCLMHPQKMPDGPWLVDNQTNPVADGSGKDLSSRTWKHDQPTCGHKAPRTTSRKPGVLVVDDDPAIHTLLEPVLWQHGFKVWSASNGLQALDIYQELRGDIDLGLIDVCMPGLDGPRTLAALQRLNPEIRCCFMSGDPGRYTEDDLLQRGAVAFLQKPFRFSDLVSLLWQLVRPSEDGGPCPRRRVITDSASIGALWN
jgi:CheY-like chemotaxis protein